MTQKTPEGLTTEERDFWKFAQVMEQAEEANPSAAACAATLKALLMEISDMRKENQSMRTALRECVLQLDTSWPTKLHQQVTTLIGSDD